MSTLILILRNSKLKLNFEASHPSIMSRLGKRVTKITEKAAQAVADSASKLKRTASSNSIKNPFKKKSKNSGTSPSPTSSPAASVITKNTSNVKPTNANNSPSPVPSTAASVIEVVDTESDKDSQVDEGESSESELGAEILLQ
jgi:hypothetical protein